MRPRIIPKTLRSYGKDGMCIIVASRNGMVPAAIEVENKRYESPTLYPNFRPIKRGQTTFYNLIYRDGNNG